MPQHFPTNWISLSISLTLTIYLTMTLIYSLFSLNKESKEIFPKWNKHWKW